MPLGPGPAMETIRATCELARCQLNELLVDREPWKIVAGTAGLTLSITWLWGQLHHEEGVTPRVKKQVFRLISMIPSVRRKIEEATRQLQEGMNADVTRMNAGMPFVLQLPDRGLPADAVLQEAERYCALGKFSYKDGFISGTVYNGSADLTELMTKVYGLAAWSNPLHPDVFPGVRKMEAEIIRMCCGVFHGGPDSCGTVTSGGTESIIMAMKACRDLAREEGGISRPEVLVPVSAHAAFDKGAQLLRMKVIHIPLDPDTSRVNVAKMRSYINSNTVMLVCSAPAFPHGNIDPIEEVAALGVKYGIPVHVDSCLGGFLVPFMQEAGYAVVPFDFRVAGVTSISADTHKYGFAPKGSSVILYSSQHMRHFQYFVQPDWPGGIYASPSMAGSRAGAVIAACWAALMFYGREGYVESTRKIIATTRYIEKECRQIPGIRIQGSSDVCVVAFASDEFNIYRLSDAMGKRGWNFNALQNPSCFHIAVTYCQTQAGVKERLVSDMRELTAEILLTPSENSGSGDVALYGMAASVPDRSLVSNLAMCYVDSLYVTKDGPDVIPAADNGGKAAPKLNGSVAKKAATPAPKENGVNGGK